MQGGGFKMSLAEEVWLPVVGYEGRYEVSSHGRLRGLIDWQGRKRLSPLILRPITSSDGYLRVGLRSETGGKPRMFNVNRLVCEAFHGPAPSEHHQSAHYNGQPNDNRAENLRWASCKENAADRDRHGKTVWGSRINTSKLSPDQVRELRRLRDETGQSYRSLGRRFGVSAQAAWKIVQGENWARLGA